MLGQVAQDGDQLVGAQPVAANAAMRGRPQYRLAAGHAIDDQLAFLAAVRAHLAPGGRFGIDLVVPHLTFLSEAQSPVPPLRLDLDAPKPAPGVARVRRTYTDRYDAATQTLTTAYAHEVYHDDGRQERWLDEPQVGLRARRADPAEAGWIVQRVAGLCLVALR